MPHTLLNDLKKSSVYDEVLIIIIIIIIINYGSLKTPDVTLYAKLSIGHYESKNQNNNLVTCQRMFKPEGQSNNELSYQVTINTEWF